MVTQEWFYSENGFPGLIDLWAPSWGPWTVRVTPDEPNKIVKSVDLCMYSKATSVVSHRETSNRTQLWNRQSFTPLRCGTFHIRFVHLYVFFYRGTATLFCIVIEQITEKLLSRCSYRFTRKWKLFFRIQMLEIMTKELHCIMLANTSQREDRELPVLSYKMTENNSSKSSENSSSKYYES